jgi:hypothetical protein
MLPIVEFQAVAGQNEMKLTILAFSTFVTEFFHKTTARDQHPWKESLRIVPFSCKIVCDEDRPLSMIA